MITDVPDLEISLARQAYYTPDGAWVVSVRQRGREAHVRVSVARLMYTQAESETPPPSWKKKLLLKQLNPRYPDSNVAAHN
ncbi:hypothetical protein ACF08O_25790 [Streptomyces paradoxus]|uniref:hypothetical protein n=1 Tax=Streptomyces paradoxus TaxID=66375 RepID=UPI003700F446